MPNLEPLSPQPRRPVRPPKRGRPHPKPTPGRGLIYYSRGAAKIAVFIAALKFVEALIAPPVAGAPRWIMAAAVTFNIWAAGAALSAVAGMGWVSDRLFGWPAALPPSALIPTRRVIPDEVMRLRTWGFNIVAGWFCFGVLASVVTADTRSGPFARLAVTLFSGDSLVWLETFVFGMLAMLAPLVVLGLLPWQTGFPLLSSMQNVVKPSVQPQARPRRRP